MDNRARFVDDVTQVLTSLAGLAQGARQEAEGVMRAQVDRLLAHYDLVTREEFEAMRAMATQAREQNLALQTRLAAVETVLSAMTGATTAGAAVTGTADETPAAGEETTETPKEKPEDKPADA